MPRRTSHGACDHEDWQHSYVLALNAARMIWSDWNGDVGGVCVQANADNMVSGFLAIARDDVDDVDGAELLLDVMVDWLGVLMCCSPLWMVSDVQSRLDEPDVLADEGWECLLSLHACLLGLGDVHGPPLDALLVGLVGSFQECWREGFLTVHGMG